MQEQTMNPLGHEPIGKLLMRFALPAVISMLVNAIYNIVDQIFIGHGVGFLGNAATTIALPIVTIILAVSTLLGAGGSAFAAIKLGEGNHRAADRSLGTVFTVGVVSGLLLSTLGLGFLTPLVTLFGAGETTLLYAQQYTGIILMAAPFNLLSICLSNFARTDGNPLLSMTSMLVGAILNTILDPIFIFVFHWGVAGAAVATAISQVVSAVMLIWYFTHNSQMRLKFCSLKPDFRILKQILILGVSSCALHLASTVLNILLNNLLVTYGDQSAVGGDVALSAMGIVMKISMIVISICVGIGVGNQPILGFNRGANQPARVKKSYLTALAFAVSFTTLGWILSECIPEYVLLLFGRENATFTDFAVRCMRICNGALFVAGMQIVTTHYFQSTGQPMKANFLSLLRQILLLVPMLLILPRFIGLDGVLFSYLFADIITGCVVVPLIIKELKKLNRQINEQ
ncbi:MAG: MATE family efflux transporter [Clostridia bacterium]|nr:MATE family efflux transporter [Clostridia bacterium]